MRILHVLDHSLPLQSGYVFRTQAILRQQRKLGWETHHLTTPKHTLETPTMETIDGWTFHRTPFAPGALGRVPVIGEAMQMRATETRLKSLIEDLRPDLLHAHSPVLNAIPSIRAGRRYNIPVVYEVRAFWEDAAASHRGRAEGGPRYWMSRALETFALKRADGVTTICEGLRHDIVERGIPSEIVTVVPNAVDIDEFPGETEKDSDLAQTLGLAGKVVLGFIGSFYAYEGLDILLRALVLIQKSLPDARVLLVGGGPEEDRLTRLTQDLGLDGQVVFAGRVPHDSVIRYYSLTDIMVYPRLPIRLTELVTPLKPLEAMAQGKMVLVSNVGGHRELVGDSGSGTLFPAGDPEALATKIVSLCARRGAWAEQGRNARRYVASNRTWSSVVVKYKNVYEMAMAKAKNRYNSM